MPEPVSKKCKSLMSYQFYVKDIFNFDKDTSEEKWFPLTEQLH